MPSKLTLEGALRKMRVELSDDQAQYFLSTDQQEVAINDCVGSDWSIRYHGTINCIQCNRKSNKSFSQGYCYPCFKSLARCDQCIMSPEKCHFHLGTCREPEWAEQFCMQDHIVYLANSSGLKVGITRIDQVPTRWIDQGAVAAVPVYRVATRRISGLLEHECKAYVADKTNWRALLKGEPAAVDLIAERERIQNSLRDDFSALQEQEGLQSVQEIEDVGVTRIRYPVASYPEKIKSFNLDKEPEAGGKLLGIKGQYLIFDTAVINLRKYSGYQISITVTSS